MDRIKKQKIVKWVETWQRAGMALEQVKNDELKQYDYKKNALFIDEMLQWACDHGTTFTFSGLIEMQRIFQKLKSKSNK
jgi:hypothetical protein